MLTLTENAQTVIAGIVGATDAAAGIRISRGDDARLEVDVAQAPEADDQVLEAAGARVFLDREASAVLDDTVLDAVPTDDGGVSFTFLQA